MNVKKIKSVGKRSLSMLLSVLMVLSLFTVCMVGTTITVGAYNSIDGFTITTKTNGWSTCYILIGKDNYTKAYQMSSTGTAGEFSVTFDSGTDWNDGHSFFFSKTDYGATGGKSENVSKVRTNLINGGYTCSKLVSRGTTEIETGAIYTIASDGTVTKSTGGSTTPVNKYGYVDATIFNYRNAAQITANKDFYNGEAGDPFNYNVYKDYNHAVGDWFRDRESSKTNKTSTPVYQGNFRQGKAINPPSGNSGTVSYIWWDYPEDTGSYSNIFYHFISLANGTNRYSALEGGSASAVALNIVDNKLNANGNVTSNGIELPQFSDEFMAHYNGQERTVLQQDGAEYKKTFGTIQSKYEDLKFPFEIKTTSNGNTKYKYDASSDGNRYLSKKDDGSYQIKVGGDVYGCKNEKGAWTAKPGYFPFNKTSAGTETVNCFGTKFEFNFSMTEDGKYGKSADKKDDLVFSFTGDDDVWVFIDGYLALDLGGCHTKASGNINLATMTSTITSGYYDGSYSANSSTTMDRYTVTKPFTSSNKVTNFQTAIPELYKSLKNTTVEHTMTIFYLERGTFDSNFSMEFMLPMSDKLSISQEIDTEDVNEGLVEQTLQVANNDVFNVSLTSNSADASSNNTAVYPIKKDFTRNGVVLQTADANATSPTGVPFNNTLNAGYSVANNTTFVWSDKSTTDVGAGKVTGSNEIQLLYDQTATFNDQFAHGSGMKLTLMDPIKKFNLPNANTAPPVAVDSSTSRTVSNFYTTSYIIQDTLDATIAEASARPNEVAFSIANATASGTTAVTNIKANITNKVKVGTISFTKKLEDGESVSDSDAVFKFKFSISNLFGAEGETSYVVPTGTVYTISNGTNTETFEMDANATIDIAPNETVTVSGIPVGTKYKIEEISETDPNKVFSVSRIAVTSGDTYVADRQDLSNGVTGTISTKATGSTNTVAFDVYNSSSTTTVVYRFIDRDTTSGLPTTMNTKYTYFTRKIPGSNVSAGKVVDYSPTIENVLCKYSLNESDVNLNYTLTSSDISNSTNPNSGIATGACILATYTNELRTYTATFDYLPLYNDGTKEQRVVSITKYFNELITLNDKITTAQTTEDGRRFLYWAKVVDVSGGDSTDLLYTPVSANYSYAYRVTDDMSIKAVYEGDTNIDGSTFEQLDGPEIVDDGEPYHPTGEGTGYAASAAEKTYDSYSKNVNGVQYDYTRVNVTFGAVGPKDSDTSISNVGYILLKNTDAYSPNSNFENSVLKSIVESKITTGDANVSVTGNDGNSYSGLYKNVAVDNFYTTGNDMTSQQIKDNWQALLDSYPKNHCNLTNKNRVNFVFDIKNNASTQKNYFTCYTFMIKGGNVYVSHTPAFFNLKEADPNVDRTEALNTYKVATSVNDTRMGTLTTSTRSFVAGDYVSFTIHTSSYEENGTPYVGKLTKVIFGNKEILPAEFATYGLTAEDGGHYGVQITEDMFNASSGFLQIRAEFVGVINDTSVNVAGKTVTGGSSQVSKDNKTYTSNTTNVKYGETFYVKATPSTGYKFVKWADGDTNATRTITLAADGKNYNENMITPVFAEIVKYTFTVATSATNGSITVTGGTKNSNGTYTVEEGKSLTFSQTPASGYKFVNWTVNGSTMTGSTYKYTPTNNNALTVTANFQKATRLIYLDDSATTAGNEKYAAWIWGDGMTSKWVEFTDQGYHVAEIPEGYTKMKIMRRDKNDTSAPNWDGSYWNESGDIVINGTLFTMKWNNVLLDGSWSNYSG